MLLIADSQEIIHNVLVSRYKSEERPKEKHLRGLVV